MKKKVTNVMLALGRDQKPETFFHQSSGKTFYSSIITFEDNSNGTFNHEGTTQSHFIVGSESEFEAENKGKWWKLTKPKKEWTGGGGKSYGWTPKTPSELKREAVGYAAGYVKDMVVAGKVEPDKFGEALAFVMDAIKAEIDKIQ